MNNSRITIDSQTEEVGQKQIEMLRSEESRTLKIIESLRHVRESKAWSSLKTEIFDNLVNVLEKDLRAEAENTDPDPKKLNRLTGELKWARRFSDLEKFENEKKVELQRLRVQLYGKESE